MMVDKVEHCDEIDAHTSFTIVSGNILLDEDQTLSAAGIIENMAQSCAARMGCVDLLHGEPIKIGYIGDVRDAIINTQPPIGTILHTHIHVVEEVFNLLLAEVRVMAGDEIIATARMKVAKTDLIAHLE